MSHEDKQLPVLQGGRPPGGLRRFAWRSPSSPSWGTSGSGSSSPSRSRSSRWRRLRLQLLLEAWTPGPEEAAGGTRGPIPVIDFLLSHITGLAAAMLLYSNDRVWVIRLRVRRRDHLEDGFPGPSRRRQDPSLLNPSNFAMTVTFVLFTWVGMLSPTSSRNTRHGRRLARPRVHHRHGQCPQQRVHQAHPLVGDGSPASSSRRRAGYWPCDTPFLAALAPMTGAAAIVFIFFMVTDPATTPDRRRAQVRSGSPSRWCTWG